MKKAASILLIVVLAAVCTACGQPRADGGDTDSPPESAAQPAAQGSGVDAVEPDAPQESEAPPESGEDSNPALSENRASSAVAPDVEPSSAVEVQQEPAAESTSSLPESLPEPSTTEETAVADDTKTVPDNDGMYTVNITVGNQVFAAKFYDNASARVLIDHMPMTLDMGDYAGQEKVLALDYNFPSATRQTPPNIRTGDIYLYSGSSLVLFYTTFSNSYSYVPIGYIEDTDGLAAALGSGNVLVTFRAP